MNASPTSSVSSGSNTLRNGPTEFIKSNKNIYITYSEGANSFQQGNLGECDTYLVGTLHLNYSRPCPIKSVHLNFKGVEKTLWHKSQARTKFVYSGEHTLVDQTNKIWEAYDDFDEINTLDIPFKIQLPYNLPDTIINEIGSIQYILRAIVNTKSFIKTTSQSIKLSIPLRRTLILDNQTIPPFKLCGETSSGIDFTFILPPNKLFNIGSYVSIPMKLKFLQPNVGIEKIEICLKTSMDFQSTNSQSELKHLDQQIMGVMVSRSDLFYTQTSSQYYGECTHTINLFVPKNVQPTYQGKIISIAHFINIKFYSWGFETDHQLEESIRIGKIVERNSQSPPPLLLDQNQPYNISLVPYTITSTPNTQTPITPQVTPPLLPKTVPTPPPINQFHFTNEIIYNNSVETIYYHQQQQQQQQQQRSQQSNKPARKPLPEQPKIFYDKPFDGYPQQQQQQQQLLNYNQSDSSESNRDSSPSERSTNSTSSIASISEMMNGHVPYPTHLSPPPYRQTTKQQDFK